MPCQPDWRQSFLVRLWAEPDDARDPAVRGFIQDVATGHKTYFQSLDLPVALLRESAQRLASRSQRRVLR
jgi:hypothetical protein